MNKIWMSAVIDFGITAMTGFLSWPEHDEVSVRAIMILVAGSVLSVLKGLKTYYATSPAKIEVSRD